MAAINTIDAREFWRIFGVFFALVAVSALVNIGFVKLGRKNWEKGLGESVQKVLDEKFPGEWILTGAKTIENPFSLSAALFSVKSKSGARKSNAVMIRTQTLYGPHSAVFLYDGEGEASFVGYSGVHGRIRALMEERNSDIFISRWARKIPQIVAESLEGGKK